MKLSIYTTIFCSLIIVGCATPLPVTQTSELNPNEILNSRKFTLQGKSFLQTTSLFLPVGSIIDFRIGSLPYYWFSVNSSDDPPTLYSRDLTTMMYFETGERKVINSQENKTMIKRISYGNYSKSDLNNFLNGLNANDYVVNIEIKDNKKSESSENNDNSTTKDKENSQGTGNDNNDLSKGIGEGLSAVPYMLFAYNKKDNTQFEIVTPSNILDIKNNKNIENIEFFLAAYPSIYVLYPGDDLKTYFQLLNEKVKNTPLNDDADCEGFIRYNSPLKLSNLKGVEGNCPYLKYWMINYLISARAVIYLNKSAVIKDFSSEAQIPDNSLSEINKLLWNVGEGKKVTISYKKQKGILNTTSMQFFERKVDLMPLSWNCDEKNRSSVCIPSGPAFSTSTMQNDINSETAIYGVFGLRPDHIQTMIEQAPKFDLNMKMINEEIIQDHK
ncbi:TPA: hypothetical protein U2K46_002321 [Acinetobacter baumannii]|nr:hypothetical protein [Acinetobacter baumannii]